MDLRSLPPELQGQQAAIKRMLSSPETRQVLTQLQKTNTSQLQAAAQAALKGDATALNGVLQSLSRDPAAAQAVEKLSRQLPK